MVQGEQRPVTGATDAEDEAASLRLRDYGPEDWIAFVFFWILAIVVFLQFYTRYVLNDSLAWTEEIARYLLICCAFIGAAVAVRKNSHIHVEFFYLYFPRRLAWALSVAVDAIRIGFLAMCTWYGYQVTLIMETQVMVVIDWPLSYMYWFVVAGFAAMTLRAVQVAVRHWRAGHSVLTRVASEGRHQ